MLSLLLATAWAEVVGVGHHGVAEGPAIEWETTLVATLDSPEETVLPLLVPLDPEVVLVGGSPGELSFLRDEQGHPIALVLRDTPRRATRFTVKTRQPATLAQLQPPLLADEGPLQRVTLDGLVYEPGEAEGLERHLSFIAPPEVDRRVRHGLDRLLDDHRAGLEDQPIYLSAGPRMAAGLSGSFQPLSERRGGAGVVVGVLFSLLLVGLGALYKLIERAARQETVEAYIRDEFVALRAGKGEGPAAESSG